ncbi:MAG TPA: hypothetical protein VK477_11165, partial [Acidobacteriota bacterium]|nr:hypothetical protein [Acidobacteriota bacterium]
IRARGIRCHLDQFKLGEVFHVMGDGSIHQRPNTGIAKWESWCISDSNYVRSTTGIRAALIRLKAANTKRWLRGKWELWLLQEFLRAMIQDVRARVAGHRVSCEINAGNIVHLLAPRALAVAELENFLDSALPSAES